MTAYGCWLRRLPGEVTALTIRHFFAGLQERLKPSSVHQASGRLRAFRWCIGTGLWSDNPLRGFTIRVPKKLPAVPTEDDLRAVLSVCGSEFHGRRSRALLLVLADAGLRASEIVRLLIEDWKPAERSLFIRSGKGRKDRVAFVAPTTARALRAYLGTRRLVSPEDFLFADVQNRPLKQRHLGQILHRPE